MMKRIVLAAAFAALGVTAVVAQGDPIAARKALMKENGNQARIAREMIEGKQPFNVDAAKKVLITFGETHDKAKNLWPDTSKTGGDTACAPRDLGEQGGLRRQARQVQHRGQGGERQGHGPRQLQGADG